MHISGTVVSPGQAYTLPHSHAHSQERKMNYMIPPPPAAMVFWPNGTYGIAYDVRIRPTEDDLPNGWNSNRGATYRRLIRVLNTRFFFQSQYSNYTCAMATAPYAWQTMFSLFNIQPPGKLESTIHHLKMYYMHQVFLEDVSAGVRLGGICSGRLRGPTPAGLVAPVAHLLFPPPAPVPPGPFHVPQGTSASPAALNPANWRV
jgi:hypothetical protein